MLKKKNLDLKHTESQEKAKSAKKEISLFISHECKKKKILDLEHTKKIKKKQKVKGRKFLCMFYNPQ